MEQYIPYSFICDLFSRNLETYLQLYIYRTSTHNCYFIDAVFVSTAIYIWYTYLHFISLSFQSSEIYNRTSTYGFHFADAGFSTAIYILINAPPQNRQKQLSFYRFFYICFCTDQCTTTEPVHIVVFFRNLIKSNLNQIAFTISD